MKPYRALVVLSLLFGLINAGKIEKILKKVGKRFDPGDRSVSFPGSTNNDETRQETVTFVGNLLRGQSSKDNEKSVWSATVLSELIKAGVFKGGICGEKDMTYVQFINYLYKARNNYLKNDGAKVKSKIIVNPEKGIDYLTFLISFPNYHATLGYNYTDTYLVQMELETEPQLGYLNYNDPMASYRITGIEQVGACTEHGEMKIDESDGVIEERNATSQFFSMFKKLDDEEISNEWLQFLANKSEFTGSNCVGGEPSPIRPFYVIQWWMTFTGMYHPVVENYASLHLISAEDKKFTFRISMEVQLGYAGNRPNETFDFKIILKQNEENTFGTVERFEVMCAPVPRVEKTDMGNQAMAYTEIVGGKLDRFMDTPEMWWTYLGSLKALNGRKSFSYDVCDLYRNKVDHIEKIDRDYWTANKMTSGKMEGYSLEAPEAISPISAETKVIMKIFWTKTPESEAKHMSLWKFVLRWDKEMQFFYIHKVVVGCRTDDGQTEYVKLRTQACRWKQCRNTMRALPG